MTARQRRWLSAALGSGLVLLLLLVVSLDDLYRPEPPETVRLTEVQIYEPPPPPPPPPPDPRDSGSADPALTLALRETPIVLEIMKLELKVEAGELGRLGSGISGLGDGAGSGAFLDVVSLSELDSTPIVMGAPPIAYPEEATERGVHEFSVLIHILIDEEGRTYPIRVVQNPFPSFTRTLEEYAAEVRFSPPTKLGIPVRTEYLWPLLIRHDPNRR